MAPIHLSQAQTHPHPWVLPPAADLSEIPTWGSRTRWLTTLDAILGDQESAAVLTRHHVSAGTLVAVARADARSADHRTGRSVATSHATVARIIGACARTVARARAALIDLGLAAVVAAGRYLTGAERAARADEGRRQIRAASTRVLILPRRLVERVHLPRRGSEPLKGSGLHMVTKRAQARARAPKEELPCRPLWLQRLAGQVVSLFPWLARSGSTHIGGVCDALTAAGITEDWSADDVREALNRRLDDAGLDQMPLESQRHPLRLVIHQLADARDRGIDPPAERRDRQEAHQRRKAAQNQRRRTEREDRDRHERYMTDPEGRSRIAEQLHQARLSWRRARTEHRTIQHTC